MVTWQVEFKPEALDELEKVDPVIAQRVLTKTKWLSENIDQITPQTLSGDLKGLFKLRIGDYRVIYSINRQRLIITVHLIGHRREVYRGR